MELMIKTAGLLGSELNTPLLRPQLRLVKKYIFYYHYEHFFNLKIIEVRPMFTVMFVYRTV